ncbi:MAG: type II and III secretion system family protein [Micavibrio aeruginosavorus]|uniref:Type II and III secretion system family protein n=1 Tax=Micavibrio aeruginosavorus TaxID=349221 RepID=A0A2W5MWV0_9BACT|nr:MAG: type II and III secretion system family protein [Micavibrio aeruginosavorus]
MGFVLFTGQGLQDKLGQALAGPHGVGWAHRFVSGYQYKGFNFRFNGCLSGIKSAKYIIAHPFYDIELDPRIKGGIIFSARNKPFDQVIDRIAESAGLRYKFDGDSVRVELDTPYHQIYKVNYLSYIRSNTSSISNDVAVVSGEGADTGSKFKAESKSEADFWGELDSNLTQILGVNREAGTLRTKKDPKITAVADSPAPVEPVLLQANGEIAQTGGATNPDGTPAAAPQVQVAAPNAVLRVEPLPVEDDEEDSNSNNTDPYQPRFSVNKQAGIVSVFGNERLQKQVAGYLDALRRSVTTQVLIEAKVLEVALSDEFSAGIDWSAVDLFNDRLSFGVDTIGEAIQPAFEPASDPSLSFFTNYVSGDFNAAIRAMQRFGTVHALASPRLTVMNNQSAVLNVAQNQVYFELDVTTNQNDNQTSVDVDSNIRNVPEGVLINVQPSIDLDSDTISMAVRPTVTRITSYVNDPAVSFAAADANLTEPIVSRVPVVNVQEFDSVLQMNSGQPIVMGGLIQDRSASTQNAVPVLGELPIVGGAFRNQSDKIEKTELVVLMKATIVEGNNTVSNTDKDLYRTFSQDRRPFDF